MRKSNSPLRVAEPAAFELIEEAVHLLRRVPPGWLAIYYAGSVPFTLGLLFFWAHTTWRRPDAVTMVWEALGLTALFVLMKMAHAEFCARLLSCRLEAPIPQRSWSRLARVISAQLRLQPWVLLATIPSIIFTVPLGWVYAYGQSATVIGEEDQLHHEAVAQAKLWPRQNHVGLLLISGAALLLWLNFAAAFYIIPWLANRLLGLDNIFNVSGWSHFNSTFVASITMLAWITIDPLIKAFYTLRLFYGRARRTGEDVRIEFRRLKSLSGSKAALYIAILLLSVGACPPSRADEAAPQVTLQPAELDRAINETFAKGDYPWRVRPVQNAETETDGPVSRFFRKGGEWVSAFFKTIRDWARGIVRWFERNLIDRHQDSDSASAGGWSVRLQRVLLYSFIVAALGAMGWLLWIMFKHASRAAPLEASTSPIAIPAPDLRDDTVQAAQLPEHGWLQLAREQVALGEWRLAFRALYLATLARHAAAGRLTLAKFKTNLDYERELRRRALSRADLAVQFALRRRAFEDAWYGHTLAGESEVRAWLSEWDGPNLE